MADSNRSCETKQAAQRPTTSTAGTDASRTRCRPTGPRGGVVLPAPAPARSGVELEHGVDLRPEKLPDSRFRAVGILLPADDVGLMTSEVEDRDDCAAPQGIAAADLGHAVDGPAASPHAQDAARARRPA